MNKVLEKLDKYLTEMAAGKKMDLGRALQLLNWLNDPNIGGGINKRKNAATDKSADDLIKILIDGIKKIISTDKDLKKAKTVNEVLPIVSALIDSNPGYARFNLPGAFEAEQDLLKVQNTLASKVSLARKAELTSLAKKMGKSEEEIRQQVIGDPAKRDKEVKKITNKDLENVVKQTEKELAAIEEILSKYRKTKEYQEKIAALLSTDPKDIASDRKSESKGRYLNSDALDSRKVSTFFTDLDVSQLPGVKEAAYNLKEILAVLWAEHRAYSDAEPADKKALLNNAKYISKVASSIKSAADDALKEFGLPRLEFNKAIKQSPKAPAVRKPTKRSFAKR